MLGALTSPRFGEFAALRRRDVDADDGELRVRRSQARVKYGRTIIKNPKSEAGKLSVAIPEVVLADLREHLDQFSTDGAHVPASRHNLPACQPEPRQADRRSDQPQRPGNQGHAKGTTERTTG
ncbi:MAG: hypothetical protein ACRDQX_00540 [Pseudonocardiaceae bacterium]